MITDCTAAVNVIRKLADEPSLSAEELKYAFDEAAQNIKDWLNEDFIPSLRDEFASKQNKLNAEPNSTLATDENGNIVSANVSLSEISRLEGLRANVQDQLDELRNSKQPLITCGTDLPQGGNSGDIYIQYYQEE